MKKVAIYIRVSTQEQAKEGYSIGEQKESLINYSKAMKWNIYDIYIDGGYSGGNIERPALEKLLDSLDNIDVVLVYKLDRLSRSQKDTLYLIEDCFIKNNVDFVSMSESFDTSTPIGKMMIGILSTFAQFERDNIRERSMTGRIARAKEGLYSGNQKTATGYKYIKEQNKLEIIDYEAMQIKKIFELYLKGWGEQRIRNYLISKGYTTRYSDWKNSSTHTIYRIIRNPIYKGCVTFEGKVYEGQHEPIIDPYTWEKAQKIYKKRKSVSTKAKYLLSGILYCKKCNSRYQVESNNNKRYYICHNRKRGYKKDIEKCYNKIYKVEELNKKVVDEIKYIAQDEKRIREVYKGITKLANKNNNKQVVKNRIKELDKQIDKLMDLYQHDNIPATKISERIEKLYDEKKKLENTISDSNTENEYPTLEEVIEIFRQFDELWDALDEKEQRTVLHDLVSRIYVDGDDIDVKF